MPVVRSTKAYPGQTVRHHSLRSTSSYYTFARRDGGTLLIQQYNDGATMWMVSPVER